MRSILINIVARFPTSIDQDKLMLESTRNSRQYFAIIYRISVKENLVDQILLIDLAMKNIEQLRNKESNADATRPVTISEITTESLPSDTPAHRKAIKEYINLVILSLN